SHYPVWQAGDFWVGKHHNIAVDSHFITLIAAVKHPSVLIFVFPCDQARLFPIGYPGWCFFIQNPLAFATVNGVDHIHPRETGDGWCSSVEDCNKEQCPAGTDARIA